MKRLTDDLEHIKLQLKQQPASVHTMQAMLEAKVNWKYQNFCNISQDNPFVKIKCCE